MKKIITISGALALSVLCAHAQGLVAGWDFASITNLNGETLNGFGAEYDAFNNGYTTAGSITTGLVQGNAANQANFSANGNASTRGGFDTTTSTILGGSETGQQSLNIFTAASTDAAVTFNFTASYDVVIDFDWITDQGALIATDILDVAYSFNGTDFVTYDANSTPGYSLAGASTAAWNNSDTDTLNGAFFAGQSAEIDLTSVTDSLNTVQAVRFTFNTGVFPTRIGLDNVLVAGTAVPEPSTYAAIAGAFALAFVVYRRRK